MYNICRIYKKTKIIKNLLMSGLQRVYKDAPNSQILKIKRFHKGVW